MSFRRYEQEDDDLYLYDIEDLEYEEDFRNLKDYYNSIQKIDRYSIDDDDSFLDNYGEYDE